MFGLTVTALILQALAAAAAPKWTQLVRTVNASGAQALELLADAPAPAWLSADFEAAFTVEVDATSLFQVVHGFGGAFTEAAGLNFLNLSLADRARVATLLFDPEDGIGYSTGRLPMGSADFALNDYSLDNGCDGKNSPDPGLACFDDTMARDSANGVIALMQAAVAAAKAGGRDGFPRIFMCPWSPPAWMKLPDAHGISMSGTASPNGLNATFNASLAAYFSRYASAVESKLGMPLWGYSLQNEPTATAGWPSCKWQPEAARDYLRDFMLPVMQRDHPGMNLLVFDHNYDAAYDWAQVLYADATVRAGAWGLAAHWYASPGQVSNLNLTHQAFPDKHILHTEGCLCNAPSGGRVVLPGDPAWFGLGESYGFGIISVLQNFGEGCKFASHTKSPSSGRNRLLTVIPYPLRLTVTDWNVILSAPGGGPFHERPFSCNAPMIQKSGELILQSPYFFLGQFSKFFVPGTQIVGAMHYAGASAPQPLGKFVYQTTLAASSPFGVLAGVTPNGTSVLLVMNAQGTEVSFKLKIQDSAYANVTVPAHSMSTFSWF